MQSGYAARSPRAMPEWGMRPTLPRPPLRVRAFGGGRAPTRGGLAGAGLEADDRGRPLPRHPARRCPRARLYGRSIIGDGQCLTHVEAAVLDRLRAMRRPGDSYGDSSSAAERLLTAARAGLRTKHEDVAADERREREVSAAVAELREAEKAASMVIPSTPGLPLLLRTRFHALSRFPRSHTSSISCSAKAGLSDAGFAINGILGLGVRGFTPTLRHQGLRSTTTL